MVGATEYPTPEFVKKIFEIVPAALTTAVAAADTVVTPDSNTSLENVIVGGTVYPDPPFVIVTIPTTP